MNAIELETWVKRVCLVVMFVLFAANSAQSAGNCEASSGKLERTAARSPSAESDVSTPRAPATVQDNVHYLSQDETSLKSFLALHCEAVSNLPLGQTIRAYHAAACGEGRAGPIVR